MFTGIVEYKGRVESSTPTESGRRLQLRAEGLGVLPVGASIAVNGVCLTAVEVDDDVVAVDVIPETLSRTNLGTVAIESSVNLERPMPAAGRFDGHIVQGHVDGTGVVRDVSEDEDGTVMTIDTDPSLLRYIVEKGSITVDGVSLTVTATSAEGFSIALIPHTLDVTTLGDAEAGDVLNLEVDILAKYVERLIRS